jgi:hypothetical protein
MAQTLYYTYTLLIYAGHTFDNLISND